ncbi:hypothetical protein DSECCO2_519080 [anaerobic digester metagenome]
MVGEHQQTPADLGEDAIRLVQELQGHHAGGRDPFRGEGADLRLEPGGLLDPGEGGSGLTGRQ